jgi:hypothetical protein
MKISAYWPQANDCLFSKELSKLELMLLYIVVKELRKTWEDQDEIKEVEVGQALPSQYL